MPVESVTFDELSEGEEKILNAVADNPQLLIDIALALKWQQADDDEDFDDDQDIENESLEIFSEEYSAIEDFFPSLNDEARVGLEKLVRHISQREDKYKILLSFYALFDETFSQEDISMRALAGEECDLDEENSDELDYSASLGIEFTEADSEPEDVEGAIANGGPGFAHTGLLFDMYEYISFCIAQIFPEIASQLQENKEEYMGKIYEDDFSLKFSDFEFGYERDDVDTDDIYKRNIENAANKYWTKYAGPKIQEVLESGVLPQNNFKPEPPAFL